jgi:multiple sugar transport system ATP-binding protein
MVSVANQTVVAVFRERVRVQPDETIWLAPEVDRVCLFDESGHRVRA